MNRLFQSLGATALALSFAVTPMMSASAQTMRLPAPDSGIRNGATFQLVDSRHERRKARRHMRHERREARRERRHFRRHVRREIRHERREARHERRAIRRFVRRNGWAYYNGYRGYHHHHHGYRYYNGWWFPPAAFLGATVIVTTPRTYSSAHVQWCYDHYRSYRASDNTYQPYHGPRRQCYSPYS
jgi:hypothetical protein